MKIFSRLEGQKGAVSYLGPWLLSWTCFLIFASAEANSNIDEICREELKNKFFPISCYKHNSSAKMPESEALLKACRRWVAAQTNETLLEKVKRSDFVSPQCKLSTQNQIDVLQYRRDVRR